MSTASHTHDHDHVFVPRERSGFDILAPLKNWIDDLEIRNAKIAHWICRIIPCQCAFERDITFFGKTFHVPALCKLNPLYDQFVYLRFRALDYLSEACGEDVTCYIC